MSNVLLVWTKLDSVAAIFHADDAEAAYNWANRRLRSKAVNCTLCCSYNDAVCAAKLIGKKVVKMGKEKQ